MFWEFRIRFTWSIKFVMCVSENEQKNFSKPSFQSQGTPQQFPLSFSAHWTSQNLNLLWEKKIRAENKYHDFAVSLTLRISKGELEIFLNILGVFWLRQCKQRDRGMILQLSGKLIWIFLCHSLKMKFHGKLWMEQERRIKVQRTLTE